MNPAWILTIPKAKRTTREEVEAYRNKRLVNGYSLTINLLCTSLHDQN